MNRASGATGWVRNPIMKSPKLDPSQASSYELGWTTNPITGCLNHTPEGLCLGGMFPCYAYKLANGRLKSRYLANQNYAPLSPMMNYTSDLPMYKDAHQSTDPFYPRLWEDRLEDIKPSGAWWDTLKGRQPKGIFVCDMSDLFGIGIPRGWQEEVLDIIKSDPLDRFYLLTKQPQNLPLFSPFPPNCWVGVTSTDKTTAGRALYVGLFRSKATVKFLSLEPLLEGIMLRKKDLIDCSINWVIIGACTGTKPDLIELNKRYPELTLMPYGKRWTLQPKIEWVESIVNACDKAGIAVFLKNNLEPILPQKLQPFYKPFWNKTIHMHDHYLRQELPK